MKLFAVILIILICFSCNDKAENHNTIVNFEKKESKLFLTASLKASFSNVNNFYYLVEVKLINNAESSCEFYTLTCGSLINILTDSKQVSFLYHNCPTNFGKLIKLLPGQEYAITVILLRNKYWDGFNSNVKFGFIVNNPKAGLFSKNLSLTDQKIFAQLKLMREKQENVIWSDPIILSSTSYCPFEIRNIINDSTYSISATN